MQFALSQHLIDDLLRSALAVLVDLKLPVFEADGQRYQRIAQSTKIYDKTGKVLWEVQLNSPVSGFPVTYSVDGKQYVAVSTGNILAGARGANGSVPPVSALYVFALPK